MIEEFAHKKISVQTLGQQLVQLRTNHKMSLEDVAQGTKIRLEHIKALERDDWGVLPASVYVRGFIRSYARFVGGNTGALLRRYEREYGVYKKNHSSEHKSAIVTVDAHKFSSVVISRIILAVVVGVIIIAIITYLYSMFRNFVSAPFLIVDTPIPGITVHDASISIHGRTARDAHIFVNQQDVLVGDDGVFANTITLSPGVNTITIKSVNRFNKETQKDLLVNFEDSTQSQNVMLEDIPDESLSEEPEQEIDEVDVIDSDDLGNQEDSMSNITPSLE